MSRQPRTSPRAPAQRAPATPAKRSRPETSAPARVPARTAPVRAGWALASAALPAVGVGLVGQHAPAWAWAAAASYALCSVASAGLYFVDKRRAARGLRRVPERTLLALDLAGGWPGGWWAQRRFRHKTQKRSFQVRFWLCVGAHQLVWLAVAWWSVRAG